MKKGSKNFKRKIDKDSHFIAKILHFFGVKYGISQDIAENASYGYGELDDNGFWQYPIYWK